MYVPHMPLPASFITGRAGIIHAWVCVWEGGYGSDVPLARGAVMSDHSGVEGGIPGSYWMYRRYIMHGARSNTSASLNIATGGGVQEGRKEDNVPPLSILKASGPPPAHVSQTEAASPRIRLRQTRSPPSR